MSFYSITEFTNLASEHFRSNLPADSHKKASHQSPPWFLTASAFCGTLKQTEAQTPY